MQEVGGSEKSRLFVVEDVVSWCVYLDDVYLCNRYLQHLADLLIFAATSKSSRLLTITVQTDSLGDVILDWTIVQVV